MFVLFLVALVAALAFWAMTGRELVRVKPVPGYGITRLWLQSQEASNLFRSDKLRGKVARRAKQAYRVQHVRFAYGFRAVGAVGTGLLAGFAAASPEGAELASVAPVWGQVANSLLAKADDSLKGNLRSLCVAHNKKPTFGVLKELAIALYKKGVAVRGSNTDQVEAVRAEVSSIGEAEVARAVAIDEVNDLETVLIRWLCTAHKVGDEAQERKLQQVLLSQAFVSNGAECERSAQLLLGAQPEEKEETPALQWLADNICSLTEMQQPELNAVFETAVDYGHVMTLNREMELQHAMCPLQFSHEEFADSLMTSRSEYGNQLLKTRGFKCLLRVSETRSIFIECAEDEDPSWPEELLFMEGEKAAYHKALKGVKYAKALTSPMSLIGEVRVEAEDLCIATEYGVLESSIDGQVVIPLSLFLAALERARKMEGGYARSSWHKLKPEEMIGRVFIGRLFIPEVGLVKGGFLIIRDAEVEFEKKSFGVIASEVKKDVIVNDRVALLCSASKLKKPKTATFDLQNTLMSMDIRSPEGTAFIESLVADQKAAREEGVDFLINKIEEDAEVTINVAELGEDLEQLKENGMKDAAVAKVLKAKGYDPRAIAGLLARLLSMAGDKYFDADRFRIQGDGNNEDGNKIVFRESNYIQAAYGATILKLEETFGRSKASPALREFYEAQCALKVDEILVPPSVYDRVLAQHGTDEVHITRRPMTLTGGVLVKFVRGPEIMDTMNGLMICSPDSGIAKYLLEPSDGADFDDSFECNYGVLGQLMKAWHTMKHKFLLGSLTGKQAQSNLKKIAGSEEFFGLKMPIHLMGWRGLDKDLVTQYKKRVREAHYSVGAHKRYSMQSIFDMLGKMKGQPALVDAVKLWQAPTVLEDMSAWMGSAANAQMFATFVLQGMVFPESHPYRAKAEAVAKNMVSIMLSDIIDAVNQGAKVKEACDNMLALQAGMLMLAEYAMRTKHIELNLPSPARKRAMWTFGNLLKDRTFQCRDFDTGEKRWEYVNGRRLSVTGKKSRNSIKWQEDGWAMQNCIEEYISWYAGFVKAQMHEGRETGHQAELGRLAAEALEASSIPGNVRSATNKLIIDAQKERGRRSAIVAKHGLSDDRIMAGWIAEPMENVMKKHVLVNKSVAEAIMLMRMSTWQKFDARELKVNIDGSTLGVSLENAGDLTAMYGDVNDMDGLWRYMLRFVMGSTRSAVTSVTVYPTDRQLWREKKAVETALMACPTGEELFGKERGDGLFWLVNKDNSEATSTNAAMHRLRVSKAEGAQEAYQKAMARLRSLKVVQGSERYSYNEKVGCWQLTLDLVQ